MNNIKLLREKCGAGMMDCKKALAEASGDITKAIEILRKQGITKAAKRSGRETSEGIIKLAISDAGNEGYIVEVNAETDFVVRNEKFQDFVNKVLTIIMQHKPRSLEDLLAFNMEDGTVKDTLDNLSGTIGEKMEIKRFDILSTNGTMAKYSHMGGRIGVLVALDKPEEDELAYNMAMQVAAANPKYIKPEDIPAEETDKEKEIYRELMIREGKPENILDKIINGKINKYFEDVCLIKQEYIKDDTKKTEDILGDVKVEKFVRYSL